MWLLPLLLLQVENVRDVEDFENKKVTPNINCHYIISLSLSRSLSLALSPSLSLLFSFSLPPTPRSLSPLFLALYSSPCNFVSWVIQEKYPMFFFAIHILV